MSPDDTPVNPEQPSSSDDVPSEDASGDASLWRLNWFEPDTKPWWRDRWAVLAGALILFIPLLGSFGLWDPWETHYGEVARNILERNDWISTWWGSHWQDAGGNQEGSYFYSKPILLMWIMSLGMSVFGFSEWGIRIGLALVATLGLVLVYSMGASVFKRRTGFLMAGVLGTSPFWFFLSRQAQTDMPFVGLMTVGMCFFMMAVFGKDRDKPADKFSYTLALGWLALVCVPQILLVLVGLSRWRGGSNALMESFTSPAWRGIAFGGALLAIGFGLLVFGIWKGRQDTDRGRSLQRWFALGGLCSIWVPLVVLLVAILVSGSQTAKASSAWSPFSSIATSASISDLQGWFVWGPTQAAIYTTMFGVAIYMAFARPIVERRRVYLIAFYVFVSLATLAKGLLGFMLPGAVLFFYILITREWRMLKKVDLHIGIPIFIAVAFPWYAAMLTRHTQGFWNRFFVHDHFKRLASGVHQIDTGSFEHFVRWLGYGMFPWIAFVPAALGSFFSGKGLDMEDNRGRATLMLIIWATVAFTLFTLSSTKFHHYIFPVVPALAMLVAVALDDALDKELPEPWPLYLVGVGILGVVAWDIIHDPQVLKNLFTYKYDRRWDDTWNSGFRWAIFWICVPGAIGSMLWLMRNRLVRRMSLGAIFATSVAFAVFGLDVYMPAISSTWSQKGVWDTYYEQCTRTEGPPGAHRFKRFCEQPIVAYKLNWRGESFYSQNEVIPIRDDDDFEHFLTEVDDGTFYGVMEMSRYRGGFQRELPQRFKGQACLVHDDNLKFKLIKVPCADDDPHRLD